MLPPVVNLSILRPFVTTLIESSRIVVGKVKSALYPLITGFQIMRAGAPFIFLGLILKSESIYWLLLRLFFYYSRDKEMFYAFLTKNRFIKVPCIIFFLNYTT